MQNPFSRVLTTTRRRLMVISAKGGVGKSTTTVNLAAALVARGWRTGIFDADVHGPNIPALLGIRRKGGLSEGMMPHPEEMITISARPDSPAMRPVKPYSRYGIQLTSLGLLVGEWQTIKPEADTIGAMVTFMLDRVDWGGADVLLLDMPPGTGEPLNSIIEAGYIDGVILVTTRERLAHLDNGRLLTLLRKNGVPVLGVVENMTHVICPKCGELIELYPAPVEAEAAIYGDVPVLASLPFHPHLIRQVRGGAPLPLAEPDSPVAQLLLALADTVMARLDSP